MQVVQAPNAKVKWSEEAMDWCPEGRTSIRAVVLEQLEQGHSQTLHVQHRRTACPSLRQGQQEGQGSKSSVLDH